MDFTSKLRAAFLTSIADLFFGVSAILLILVVIPRRPADEERAQRYVDQQVWCERSEGGWNLATADGSRHWTMPQWFKTETSDALLIRVGVWAARNEVECYRKFAEAALKHNAHLTERGNVSASVAPMLLPNNGVRVRTGSKQQ